MSRLLPGPAPEGRWDELSSGECALLGASGAALTGPIVGAVLAMMSWTAACCGRPRARQGGQSPRLHRRDTRGLRERGAVWCLPPHGHRALGRAG